MTVLQSPCLAPCVIHTKIKDKLNNPICAECPERIEYIAKLLREETALRDVMCKEE